MIAINKLSALGLTLWQPRPFRHPSLAQQQTLFVAPQIRMNASCLVISYEAQLTPITLNAEEQKILTGMLSVLNLPNEQIMSVTIYSLEPDLALIKQTISEYKAQTVLQLSSDLADLQLPNYIRTFSPQYLLTNSSYKPQAYKDLLALRKILDDI